MNYTPTLIDKTIGYFAPGWGAKRAHARLMMQSAAEVQNLYLSESAGRADTFWPADRAYRGLNSSLNTWRLTRLRDRARHLVQNNVLAAGMLERAVENVIGHGMRLQAQTEDHGFNAQVEDLWHDWIDSADIRGLCSGADFQRMIYRAHLLDGDVGCGLVSRGDDAYLQGYEGDVVNTLTGGSRPGENIIDGIKFGDDGNPLGFFVTPFNAVGVQTEEFYIPGRNFIYLPRLKRLSQIRGEPCFAQVFQLFDQIEGYKEAVIIAARVAACQSLIVKKASATTELGGLKKTDNGNNRLLKMEPGTIQYLQPGEEIETVNPSQPSQSFADFIAALLRFAGLTLGLPLELTLLDFSKTNYSSARASLLQAYRSFRQQQQFFCDRFMARAYRWRVSKWVKSGRLVVPAALKGDPSLGQRPRWWDHSWTAPGWGWVDPVKEIQAAMMGIDAGLDTVTGVLQQKGQRLEDVIATRKRELKQFAELGIEISKSNLTREATLTPSNPPGASKGKNGQATQDDPPDRDDPDRTTGDDDDDDDA